MSEPLSPQERAGLLRLARAAIQDALRRDGSLPAAEREVEISEALRRTRGVFVTLKKRAEASPAGPYRLRGCIGTVRASKPLYSNVIETAPRAALEDPRFPPLAGDEIDLVRIEISALTPLRELADVAEIVIGRDGVELTRGDRHAVFLPQVAPEQGWSTEQLLEHLALKAGLERSAWREGRLRAFQAEVFGERSGS